MLNTKAVDGLTLKRRHCAQNGENRHFERHDSEKQCFERNLRNPRAVFIGNGRGKCAPNCRQGKLKNGICWVGCSRAFGRSHFGLGWTQKTTTVDTFVIHF